MNKLNSQALKAWKAREGRTWGWLARQIGVAPTTLSQQLNGHCGLSLTVALALEKTTGIAVADLVVEEAANGSAVINSEGKEILFAAADELNDLVGGKLGSFELTPDPAAQRTHAN